MKFIHSNIPSPKFSIGETVDNICNSYGEGIVLGLTYEIYGDGRGYWEYMVVYFDLNENGKELQWYNEDNLVKVEEQA